MSQGWFNRLVSKPVKRSPEEIAADMWITAERKRLQDEQCQREAAEAQERAAVAAATPKCSSVARLAQIDLSTARDPHVEWRMLTGQTVPSTL